MTRSKTNRTNQVFELPRAAWDKRRQKTLTMAILYFCGGKTRSSPLFLWSAPKTISASIIAGDTIREKSSLCCRFSQIFADFRLALEIKWVGRKPQMFAGNRRFCRNLLRASVVLQLSRSLTSNLLKWGGYSPLILFKRDWGARVQRFSRKIASETLFRRVSKKHPWQV